MPPRAGLAAACSRAPWWSPTRTSAQDSHCGPEGSVSSEMQQLGQLLKMLTAKPDHRFEPGVLFPFFW